MVLLLALTIYASQLALFLGQAATSTASSVPDLGGWLAIVNIGLAGIGLFAFVKGWIVPGYIHEQTLKREQALIVDNLALRKTIEEKIIPEMVKSQDIQEQMIDLTQDFLKIVESQRMGNNKN